MTPKPFQTPSNRNFSAIAFSTENPSAKLPSLLSSQTVIPVLTINDAPAAVPLVRAQARGGLRVTEVTLRTPAALRII